MSSISAPSAKSKKRRKGGNVSSSSNFQGTSLEDVAEPGIIIVDTNDDLSHYGQVTDLCCFVQLPPLDN